jgi:hypothetical protein
MATTKICGNLFEFDLAIRGGRIFNGTGAPSYKYGIQGEGIVCVRPHGAMRLSLLGEGLAVGVVNLARCGAGP